MRKFAIRGLVCLAAVVALSMFFAGTIRTMTTAKVQIVTAKEGRLEARVTLTGRLAFPETTQVSVPGVGGEIALTVSEVYVAPGRFVEAGEALFAASVTDYDKLMAGYQAAFDEAQGEAMEAGRKIGAMRMTRAEEMWIEAYDALCAAEKAVLLAETDIAVHDNLHGEDGEARKSLEDALSAAEGERESAQAAFDRANRLGVNMELAQLVLGEREAREKMAKAGEDMANLRTTAERAACVYAPHAGYVVETAVEAGKAFDGQGAAVVLSAESADQTGGVLRAALGETGMRIEPGTKVAIAGAGAEITAEITALGVGAGGSWHADAALTRTQIAELGGAEKLMNGDVSMTCSYRAQTSTTLLPVSAVRGTGEERYVYTVSEQRNALSETTMTVTRQTVHVLAQTEDTVSIEEGLGRQRIAYMEDRPIEDGAEVMVYAQ